MKIELFLDKEEEYPQLFSVWRMDQNTGRADLTTRRNYINDREGWDQWRKTVDENIRLKTDNTKLREFAHDLLQPILAEGFDCWGCVHEDCCEGMRYTDRCKLLDRACELGVETGR